jgi:hypothetical protein
MFVDGLQAVEEFHQRYRQKPGPLQNVLGGPPIKEGDIVIVRRWTEVLRNTNGYWGTVFEELCYGRAEKLEDVEEVARLWRYNLV